MCGIIAISGSKVRDFNHGVIDSMLHTLAKRGPDDIGSVSIGNTILGHTRLSIIDLSSGHQPMRDNAHNITITFNGEIYNYKELRLELEKKGHYFSTNSDTEVILKAYIEYGSECPKHLDGMFAFALWNEEAEELFIARDRFGKKPFYYSIENDTIIVASEIKALLQAGVKGEIDLDAIDNYLALMYIPPWKSVYKNIKTLPPAWRGVFKNAKLEIAPYWELKDKPITVSYEEAKSEIKRLLEESVKKRMVSDVEVGVLLSGGVDSTLVCLYAQKFTSHALKTFSIGYENYINELPYAEEASKKIGTEHYTLQAKSDLIHELENVIAYMDEPHADSSIFPQHLISELAASKVKVALSGDGADELFMGYGWYWKYWNTQKYVQLKNTLFSNPFKEHIKLISIFNKNERKMLWNDSSHVNDDIIGPAATLKRNDVKKINLFDLTTYLPGQLLSKIDRTSMMHSLEVRSPFLDYRLAEYVYNIPEKYKHNKKDGKLILKDILSEYMPKVFVYRRKQGFGAPISAWLKTQKIREFVYQKIGDDALIYDFLKKDRVLLLLQKFYIDKNDKVHYQLWSLLCLELWLQSKK